MNASLQIDAPGLSRLPPRSDQGAALARLAGERGYLRRVALQRLRDDHLAEDAVQDTLLAAMQAIGSFEGRASLRTWLVAILRNKVNDLLGRSRRELPMGEVDPREDGDDEPGDEHFDDSGAWQAGAAPRSWGDPALAAQNHQFWQVLEACLAELPARSAEAFRLREIHGESTAEICARLGISPSNCAVMLFRARSHLRAALETRWFGGRR